MTASVAPPPWNSWRGYLERTAAVSRIVAALLVTLVSVRFSIAGLDHALSASRSNFAPKPVPHGSSRAGPRATPQGSPAATDSAPKPAPGPIKSIRVTLGVTAGPPRSEVYVNGRLVGQAPFLGDTACKEGQPLRIEVVPPSGPPLTYERKCAGSMLEITEVP